VLPTIRIGPLALPTDALILLVSFIVALEVAHRAATRLHLSGDDVYNLGYVAAIAGLLGARLGFVLQYWEFYQSDLAAIVSLNTQSMSPSAGLACSLIAGYAFAQRKHLDSLSLLDALTPGLAVMLGGLALANLASGEGYGAPTSLPWAVTMWNAPRHPVQLYHFLAVAIVGLVVARWPWAFSGAHFGVFVALYATSLLVLEPFRADSAAIAGVRTTELASFALLLGALVLLRRWALQAKADSSRSRET
jgi:phosphatidylglycerol:prolipoprotein diacylglycerol transferase